MLARRCLLLQTVFFGLLLCVFTEADAQGAAASKSDSQDAPVLIKATQKRGLAGLPLRVFREAQGDRWTPVDKELVLDRAGEARLTLPPGTFRFEVLTTLSNGELLCVRSPATVVQSGKPVSVTLPAFAKHRVSMRLQGKSMRISQVSVASLGMECESWISASGKSFVVVLAPEGEQLTLEVIGDRNDVVVAGWLSLPMERKIVFEAGGEGWYATKLRADAYGRVEGAPKLRSAEVELHFPASVVQRELKDELTVWSNHRVAGFRYQLIAAPAGLLVSRGTWLDLEQSEVTLGGPLRPEAWAAIAWKDDNKWRLQSGVSLMDAGGREIDVEASSIGWKATVQTGDGAAAPDAKQVLTEPQIKALNGSVVGLAEWDWGGKQQYEGTAVPFAKWRSDNFTLFAPEAWRHRAITYLGYLESVRRACLAESGRGGPKHTEIRWRLNTHNAKAIVGGRHPWMSMPWRGLIQAEDPYKRPWFMTHEMVHTFGYHHGEEMDRVISLCNKSTNAARWLPAEWDHLAPRATMTPRPDSSYRLK